MGICCSANTILAEIAEKIQAELGSISDVFPGTDFVCVLGAPPTSELLWQLSNEGAKVDELVPLFTHLKRVADEHEPRILTLGPARCGVEPQL